MSFTSIPILDLSQAQDIETKSAFLDDLRHALMEVGFFYISNTGLEDSLIQDVITQGKLFFDLPDSKKLKVQMKNAASFLGYNKLGNEITRHATDWREQLDLSTPHPLPPPHAPLYHNLLSPNQWPSPTLLPSFRPVYESYIRRLAVLATAFTRLIAEALDLPAAAFERFFDADQQHKLKVVKYPDLDELGVPGEVEAQGVGPHKDSMLTSYLLQASPHRGLQAQNMGGEWIDCPPIPGTLVVAIGQGLEALTHGVCASTTHRVLSPGRGQGARFSVPFFQGVSYDATFESVEVPERVRQMRTEVLERNRGRRDDVEFTFRKGAWAHLGEATLWNRCKSHMDVAERWYPEIWRKIREEQGDLQKAEKESKRVNGQVEADEQAYNAAIVSGAIEAH